MAIFKIYRCIFFALIPFLLFSILVMTPTSAQQPTIVQSFDSPGDPLVAARMEAIHARKGNPFMEYQLPSAIISLKQGFGRLIRKSTDKGVLAILDARIIKSRYGRFFFDSLPSITLSHELKDMKPFFKRK